MSALKHAWLSLLFGAFACDGPQLSVGHLRGNSDETELDAGDDLPADAGASSDGAQQRDGRVDPIEFPIRCANDNNCPREAPHCVTGPCFGCIVGICVACTSNWECDEGEECDFSRLPVQCRRRDEHKAPSHGESGREGG